MKTRLFISALLLAGIAQAQNGIKKGSLYSGATFGFSSRNSEYESKNNNVITKGEPSKERSFEFVPEVSYFIADNLAIGAALGINTNRYEYSSGTGNNQTDYVSKGSGPVIRAYIRKFWNCTENFYTFADAGFSIEREKGSVESTFQNITTKRENEYSYMGLNVRGGLGYHVTPKLILVGQFGLISFYNNKSKTNISGDDYNLSESSGINFYLSSGYTPFNLGFLYLLSRSK